MWTRLQFNWAFPTKFSSFIHPFTYYRVGEFFLVEILCWPQKTRDPPALFKQPPIFSIRHRCKASQKRNNTKTFSRSSVPLRTHTHSPKRSKTGNARKTFPTCSQIHAINPLDSSLLDSVYGVSRCTASARADSPSSVFACSCAASLWRRRSLKFVCFHLSSSSVAPEFRIRLDCGYSCADRCDVCVILIWAFLML